MPGIVTHNLNQTTRSLFKQLKSFEQQLTINSEQQLICSRNVSSKFNIYESMQDLKRYGGRSEAGASVRLAAAAEGLQEPLAIAAVLRKVAAIT